MGNHDYSAFGFAREVGGDPVLAQHVINFLQSSSSVNGTENNDDGDVPITIIRNEKVIINDDLTIIGLDDLWAHLRDEERAYLDKENKGYRILLSHNQEDLEINKEVADLFLFGPPEITIIKLNP